MPRPARLIVPSLFIGTLLAVALGMARGPAAAFPDTRGQGATADAAPDRHLLIVVDGLRPDYVTPEVMPHLSALADRGVRFTRHHAVFPTVTRVNAASFTTGAYPERHGLLGNSVFRPRVDATRFLDTADLSDLDRILATEPLLDAPSLGDVLAQAGRGLLVVSSGSAGSALVNHPTSSGGAVLHRDFTRPASIGEAMRALPSRPAADASRAALDAHAVDAFFEVGLPRVDPAITVLWLGALDGTAHAHGVGDPRTVEVLRLVDAQIARVQDGLAARGLLDRCTIWVSSDHGFSTHTGAPDVSALLAGIPPARPDGSPTLVAGGGAIYVREDDPKSRQAIVTRIVDTLQQTPGIGPVFTTARTPGAFDGAVPGTLSFDAIRWQHSRAADVLYAADWSDAVNAHGRRGATAAGGTAGHGSASPWDIHNTLIAAGRGLGRGRVVDLPSANVDLAPTMLTMLGLPLPPSMQGRVLREAFEPGATGTASTATHTVRSADGAYAATATFTTVRIGGADYRYLDRITTTRASPPR